MDKRNNNTPIISDAEIDELAEIILETISLLYKSLEK